MLRIIHTADVHLGARHDDLGEQAAAQRERQFAAFTAAVDLAIAEKVDLFLIAGDLFDSNVQPRRSVERVAAELKRLADARIRTVIIPGTHDVYDRASIYRAYDLPAMAGSTPDDDMVTVLDPGPSVGPPRRRCDVIVHGQVFAHQARAAQPARGTSRRPMPTGPPPPGTSAWSTARSRSRARPTATRSSSRPRRSPRPGSTTSPSATGTRPSRARPAAVTYAYAGAPEAVALDQDRAGKVLLVELDETAGTRDRHGRGARGRPDPLRQARARRGDRRRASRRSSSTWPRGPTRTSCSTSGSSASAATSSTSTSTRSRRRWRRRSSRSASGTCRVPALTEGPLPVARHDRRRVHPRPRGPDRRARGGRRSDRPRPPSCATRSASGGCCSPATRSRCEGPPAAAAATSAATASFDIDLAPGLTVVRGPNEAGKSTIQRALELALTRRATSTAGELEALRPWDAPPEARSIDHHRVRAGRGGRPEDRHPREDVRRLEGDRQARLRRPVDHRPDPRRPGHGRADRHPDRGFFRSTASVHHHRAERPVARRGRAARPAPGVDQRRGPGHQPGPQEARPGAPRPRRRRATRTPGRLKVAEQAVEQAAGGARPGRAGAGPARARPRRAVRRPASAGPRPRPPWPNGAALLEKARQAERIVAERDAATGALRALPPGGRGRGRARRRSPRPIRRRTRCRSSAAAVERLRDARRPDPRAAAPRCRARSRSSSTSRRSRPGGRCRAGRSRSSSSASSSRPGRSCSRRSAIVDLGRRRPGHRRRSSRSSGSSSPPSRCGCGGATRCRPSCATSRSTGGCAAGRTWRPSSRTPRPRPSDAARGARPGRPRRRPRTCSPARRRTSPRSTGWHAQLEGLVGKEPTRDAAAPARRRRARDRAEDERARGARADRQGAACPRAARGRGPRPGGARSNAPATTRRTPGPGSRPTPSMPSRSPAQAERLAAWREQLAALQRRQRVFAATLAAHRPRRAGDDEDRDPLSRGAHGRATSRPSTGGRYRRVRVDDKTLDIEVHAPEKDDWVQVTSLSQGTLDLVYLVARLGLVRLVTGDRRPPLVFDDPFVTLDDGRATRALELLKSDRDRLPGHLPDDVAALRRRGRRGRRARRPDRASTPADGRRRPARRRRSRDPTGAPA